MNSSFFRTNVGAIDQFVRIALGFVLVFLAGIGTIGVWGYIGLVLMATGGLRFCPAYRLLGISTGPRRAAIRKKTEPSA